MSPLVCLAFLTLRAAAANPYLAPAQRLYEGLEFQEALKMVEKAAAWPNNTPEEEAKVAMLEGVVTAQLGRTERALSAFKRALALDRGAVAPVSLPPKISALLERARREMPAPPVEPPPGPVSAPAPPPVPPPPPADAGVAAPPPAQPTPGSEPKEPVAPEPAPAPAASRHWVGVMAGVLGIFDVLGPAFGGELHAGATFRYLDASLRLTLGGAIGIGALLAGALDLRIFRIFLGARGDFFPAVNAYGGGGVIGGRVGLPLGFGVVAQAAFELFKAPVGFSESSLVLSLGLDWRWR
jgi:hypothetical protein